MYPTPVLRTRTVSGEVLQLIVIERSARLPTTGVLVAVTVAVAVSDGDAEGEASATGVPRSAASPSDVH